MTHVTSSEARPVTDLQPETADLQPNAGDAVINAPAVRISPEAQSQIEVRVRRPWRERIGRRLGTVGVVATIGVGSVAAYGAFRLGEDIWHEFNSFLHSPKPNLHLGLGAGPAHGTDTPRPDLTYTTEDFVTCSDTIMSANGVDVSSQDLIISGYTINHLWPIDWPACTPSGLLITGQAETGANGKVTITAQEPEFSSRWGRVDFNRGGILCEDNPANASNSHVRAEEKIYREDRRSGKDATCNFGEHTTGLDIVTDNVPAKDEMLAGQLAQDAAELIPPDKKVEEQIIKDGYKEIKETLEANHPGATIVLTEEPLPSPVQEIEGDWDANGSNVEEGAEAQPKGLKFANVKKGNKVSTELLINSEYGGSGADILPMRLTKGQVEILNGYINEPHPTPNTNVTKLRPKTPPPQIERRKAA